MDIDNKCEHWKLSNFYKIKQINRCPTKYIIHVFFKRKTLGSIGLIKSSSELINSCWSCQLNISSPREISLEQDQEEWLILDSTSRHDTTIRKRSAIIFRGGNALQCRMDGNYQSWSHVLLWSFWMSDLNGFISPQSINMKNWRHP